MSENTPQLIEHVSKSVSFTPFEARWVPSSARFVGMGAYARGTGAIQVFSLDGEGVKLVAEREKKDAIKCGTFKASLFEHRHLATGGYSGELNIWDLEKLDTSVFKVQAHSSMINCVDGCGGLNIGYGSPELATGSRDGCVRVWDPRTDKAVASLEPAEGQAARDCWAVAFGNSWSDEERSLCAGYDNGDVKLLDLRMNKLLWETNIKNGIVGIEFDRPDIKMNKLVVTSLESRFRVFDMRTCHPSEGYSSLTEQAHKSTVWRAVHLPQNRDIFVTTGGNGTLNLYKYIYPANRVSVNQDTGVKTGVMGSCSMLNTRKFSDQPVVSFDWHPDKMGLCVMACLDQTLKVGIVSKLNKV